MKAEWEEGQSGSLLQEEAPAEEDVYKRQLSIRFC